MRLLAWVLVVLFFLASPLAIFAEEINSFSASYMVNTDGTVDVVEEITYDFGSLERHGIFRTIPLVKTNQDGKKYVLTYSDISVTDAYGAPYQFSQSHEVDELKIKIGDPDKTITGIHTYVIRYQVSGALTYFSEHDEFYWNATGNGWEVPINHVKAVVSLPNTISPTDIQHACYTGTFGSTANECAMSVDRNRVTILAQSLDAYEGLTIVVGFPPDHIAHLEPKPFVTFFETFVGKVVLVVLGFVVLLWYVVAPLWVIRGWFKFGRDPKPVVGVTSAWFDAPYAKNHRRLTPGETGTLLDEQADLSDICATIVDLARRGYLKILESKKNDFHLEKRSGNDSSDSLEPHENTLLSGIFKTGDVVRIKGTDFTKTVLEAKKELYTSVVNEGFFLKNPESIRSVYAVISFLAFITGNIFLALVAYFFGRAMPRKTLFGAERVAVAQSLKNFLKSQDEKLSFQAKNQMFFEKLLPYAVAFGVEKVWAERFADIEMKRPDWYVGYGNTAFTSGSFVNSLNFSLASFRSAASPTRSSSGFSSGFSGGSSGGGGGGGGGGSW